MKSSKDFLLTNEDKMTLLRIARDAMKAAVEGKKYEPNIPGGANLAQAAGAFVTLKENGELRGCIGIIEAKYPLYQVVTEMAQRAATCDPRFDSVKEDEVEKLDLEISVLSPPRKIGKEDVEIGRDGLIIERGIYRGLLLPQVATENKWNREEFLEYTCMKAGLDKESYKEPGVNLYAFSAEVFGEREYGIASEESLEQRK
jgi:AmmeMemoRadiSam system protein A